MVRLVLLWRNSVPRAVTKLLNRRKTNIVAYELLAAYVALVSMDPESLRGCKVVHFVDSSAALACVIKGYSKQLDAVLIAGGLWFEACALTVDYTAHYIPSKSNIADGPSWNDVALYGQFRSI